MHPCIQKPEGESTHRMGEKPKHGIFKARKNLESVAAGKT